jgi:type I restriction enzyme, S subunit
VTEPALIELSKVMALKLGSVDPSKHSGETFDLYSIPSFDLGEPEVVTGAEIGSTKQIVEPGDVLLSKIVPHIRRAWVVGHNRGRRIIASGEWIVFRGPNVHPQYLRHVLVGDPFHAQFMRTVSGVGGSLLRARPSYVAKISIPLPPISEQRRIAEVLDRAEALRAKRRAALAQLDTLTQSIFLEMFGDRRGDRTSSMPLGKAVAMVTVGHVGPTSEYFCEDGVPFLRTGNIGEMEIDRSGMKYVTPEFHRRLKKSSLREGDVLVSRVISDEVRCTVVPAEFDGANCANVILIRPGGRVTGEYLAQLIHSPLSQTDFLRRRVGSAQSVVNTRVLQDWIIPVPPLKEQVEFSERTMRTEHLRARQRAELAMLDELFATLQHRAFRGEL